MRQTLVTAVATAVFVLYSQGVFAQANCASTTGSGDIIAAGQRSNVTCAITGRHTAQPNACTAGAHCIRASATTHQTD